MSSYKRENNDFIDAKKQIKEILKQTKNYMKTNVLFFTFLITSFINELMLRGFTIKNSFLVSL